MTRLVRLFELIDEHRAREGRISEAAFARKVGIEKNTLNGWKNRGVKAPPSGEQLRAIADEIGQPYREVVLAAVLMDLGWEPPHTLPVRRPVDRSRGASAG